jgi:hypothetical protein
MTEVKGQFFEDRRVPIDGIRFVDCTFVKSKLIFGASDTVSFDKCTFDECVWVFEGAALFTLQLLSALYSGLGIEGIRLVEAIVDGIRQGRVGQDLHRPEVAAVA